jgi:hypothetical protein
MTRCSKVWLALAAFFLVGNLAGGLYAAVQGELLHAGGHVALVLIAEYVVLRLLPRRVASY